MLARSKAPPERPDTLMQLSRSPAQHSALRRTAGPYIVAPSGPLPRCSDLVRNLRANRRSADVTERTVRDPFSPVSRTEQKH